MGNLLATVIVWSLSTFTARLFSAMGLSFVSYQAISTVVDNIIQGITPMLYQLPADVLALLSLCGVGQGMTLVASAMITRATFISAQVFLHTIK